MDLVGSFVADVITAFWIVAILAILIVNILALALHLGRTGFGAIWTIAASAIVALNISVIAALASLSIANHLRLATAALLFVNGMLAIALLLLVRGNGGWPSRPRLSLRILNLAGGSLLLVVALIFLQIVLYAPTGHDSMAYHLPKVAHLIDTGSVSPFAAHYPHVIETPWGYSYAVYFLWIFGGDGSFGWFGLVQLIGFAGILGVLQGVLSDLASTRRRSTFPMASTLLGVVVLSPMMILQAPSTRNDLVTTAFCLMAMRGPIYFICRRNESIATRLTTMAALLGFGLAGVLAFKPNLAIQAGIFSASVAMAWLWADRRRIRSFLRNSKLPARSAGFDTLLVLSLLVIGLSTPFIQATASNLATFGKITGPASESALGGVPGPADAVCRVALSLAYEGSSPGGNDAQVLAMPGAAISGIEQSSLKFVAGVCGSSLEAESNNLTPFVDPFRSEIGSIVGGVEDTQMSRLQLHFLLVVCAALVCSWISRAIRRRSGSAGSATELVPPGGSSETPMLGLAVFTLLSAAALGPWQYYSNSRFLLPSWLLVSTLGLFVVVPYLRRWLSRGLESWSRFGPPVVRCAVVLILSAQAIWTVVNNAYHPLPLSEGWNEVERGDDWTAFTRAGSTPPIEMISFALSEASAHQCGVLGVTESFIWTFPLWLAGRESGVRVVDVDVESASGRFEQPSRQRACLKFGLELDGESDRPGFIPGPYGWSVWL